MSKTYSFRQKSFFIFTLGCQMNLADSQKIASKIENEGCKLVSEKEAKFIIVNACSVRQKAVDRIWGKIKIWQPQGKKIILTGCVLPEDARKFAQKGIDYVDFQISKIKPETPQDEPSLVYIPIMTGCDNFCSYCAVPYTRGREKSRPIAKIIGDVECALKNNAKEILLLGQNVNSYEYGFAKLLKKIDQLPGDFQFNFISSNPHDMNQDIIKTFGRLKKWPRELHLAMQSGDDEILKKMNRKYSRNQYLELASDLKSLMPNLKLSTDIIVGFPGETKKQFQNTVELCRKIKFNKAYIAQYSPRSGTAAAKLNDDIPSSEKRRRWQILENLINK